MCDIQQRQFGEFQGQPVSLYTLSNKNGIRLSVTDYGCIITELWVPDRQGKLADVVLGFDTLAPYLAGHPFFGAVAGRCANRIANGRFELDGHSYSLATNEAPTGQHLHGGARGFDKYVWQSAIEDKGIRFSRTSADGEEGYPGKLEVSHYIGLTDDNRVVIQFSAITDKPTIVNLVNHSYYNLAGHQQNILGQQLQIFGDFITPVNEQTMLPTGEIVSVIDTAYDFRDPQTIADAMERRTQRDFDVNYVLRRQPTEGELHPAAELFDPTSGRVMTVMTNQPGVQFYNAFKLSNKVWIGKQQHQYQAFSGLCLETQAFPDSIHWPHFSNIVLRPGELYQANTEHCFSSR